MKPNRRRRRLQHRVEAILAHAVVGFQQAAHEIVEVAGPRADEFRQGVAVMVRSPRNTPSDEPRVDKARVLDEDALKADDFVESQAVPAGLQDRAAHRSSRLRGGRSPSISKLARLSASSMKLAARAMRCALVRPTVSRAFAERSRAINSSRAFVRRMTGQNRPVPRRLSRTRCRFESRGCPMKYAFGSRRSTAHRARGVLKVEGAPGQGLIQEPRRRPEPCGCGADEGLHLPLWHSVEDPLEDQKVDILAGAARGQMIGKGSRRPVALVEDEPGAPPPGGCADILSRRRPDAAPAPQLRAPARAPPSRPAACRREPSSPERSPWVPDQASSVEIHEHWSKTSLFKA